VFKHQLLPRDDFALSVVRLRFFNLLGAATQPGRAVGVCCGRASTRAVEPLARVLKELGVRRAMVVCEPLRTRLGPCATWMSYHPLALLRLRNSTRNTPEHFDRCGMKPFPIQPAKNWKTCAEETVK